MKDLIEYIAKNIVDNPDAVKVTESSDAGLQTFLLEVSPEDKGKVIGKQGRIAQAIRSLVRVAATKNGSRANLEII